MVTGWWAIVPASLEEPHVWHGFAGDDARPVPSRCAEVTLPVECVGKLEAVPHGRPCVSCPIDATKDLPHVGRMGTAS